MSLIISEIEMPIEVCRNIYLICKEGINNSLTYSQATSLKLDVRDFDHTLELVLKDNGIEFDLEQVKKGDGLDKMQKVC